MRFNIEAIEKEVQHIGIKKFLSNPYNRKYWAAVQKKYEIDLLQPSHPPFKKHYGDKIARNQAIKEKQIRLSQDEWAENADRRRFTQSRLHPLIKNP